MFSLLYYLLVSPSATPSPGSPFATGGGSTGYIYLIGFLVFIIFLRIMRGIRGRRFSQGRVLMLPVIYILITLATVIPLELSHPIALISLAGIPAGFVVGYLFGQKVQFFNKNGMLYFKRSPVIMIIWLVSFVIRIVLEFEFTLNFQALFAVDVLLAVTSGLLIGESIHILRSHAEHKQKNEEKRSQEETDYVKEM